MQTTNRNYEAPTCGLALPWPPPAWARARAREDCSGLVHRQLGWTPSFGWNRPDLGATKTKAGSAKLLVGSVRFRAGATGPGGGWVRRHQMSRGGRFKVSWTDPTRLLPDLAAGTTNHGSTPSPERTCCPMTGRGTADLWKTPGEIHPRTHTTQRLTRLPALRHNAMASSVFSDNFLPWRVRTLGLGEAKGGRRHGWTTNSATRTPPRPEVLAISIGRIQDAVPAPHRCERSARGEVTTCAPMRRHGALPIVHGVSRFWLPARPVRTNAFLLAGIWTLGASM